MRERLNFLAILTFLGLSTVSAQTPVGQMDSQAMTADGRYIRWIEHIIDSEEIAGFNLNGADGLVMGDLDRDGYADIVSVHESDSTYDSSSFDPDYVPTTEGYVRIGFGSASPDEWVNITLAEDVDAPAPEDAAIADVNGDGWLDVVVAAELSHLLYLQNPGTAVRSTPWPRLVLPMTKNRGSYIRVFFADFDGDGQPEISAANKGAQRPGPQDYANSTPVSIFSVDGDPLAGENWQEIVLGNFSVPQNAEPVDIDSDGDLDIMVGSRGENRLILFENTGQDLQFVEHAVGIVGSAHSGFNLAYADINADGRLDIINPSTEALGWLEQPEQLDHAWVFHSIGQVAPDTAWSAGLEVADINGDGLADVLMGTYSKGDRQDESNITVIDPLGRLVWFENPGSLSIPWQRHDISRRKRGMFDKFIARDMDNDGDIDFVGTRGNSAPYDGVYWLEQVRSTNPAPRFTPAREQESIEMPLPYR